jgi:succinylglutamate desuccinylase
MLSQAIEHVFLNAPVTIVEVADDAYRIIPDDASLEDRDAFTLAGAVHGDEVIGVHAIAKWLHHMVDTQQIPSRPFSVLLGNPRAFAANRRFTERDLNRCFDASNPIADVYEYDRAKALEPLLRNTDLLLDIHQTIGATLRPFFIFPYALHSVCLAHAISPTTAIVTRWGQVFSQDGACTDEFVIRHGGVAVTLECGQKGYDPEQEQFALQAIEQVVAIALQPSELLAASKPPEHSELFKLDITIPFPSAGEVWLEPSLQNFSFVSQGSCIARHDGRDILAPISGYVLFPKHASLHLPAGQRPGELLRIAVKIQSGDLPA